MSQASKPSLGIANLPNQVHRKSVKKGFEFTVMVIGEAGLGKRTLLQCLFSDQLSKDAELLRRPSTIELNNRKIEIKSSTYDIEDGGVKLRLTVVNTPGFADAIDCTDCMKPITDYIDEQFERYLNFESGLNRKHITDTRVHCCFYFLSPISYGLKPIDIYCMKALDSKVNIIPIIGRADALTPTETKQLKKKIMEDIKANSINIYSIGDCEEDEDEGYKSEMNEIKSSVPFAVCASNEVFDLNKTGKMVKGRQYAWGLVEVENRLHCDFVKLRSLLVYNMQDLREITQELHYENYRATRLASSNGTYQASDSLDYSLDEDKERILREKEAELRRMKEMLEQYQEQIKQINSENTSLNGANLACSEHSE